MPGEGSVRRLDGPLGWLAWASAGGMFLVLVMGATVTSTGSAEGCGRDWPLCHGQFIPDFAVATAIEFSHRAVTGIEGILIVALVAGMLVLHRDRREIRVLAPLLLGSLLLQAGMGAWAVKYPQSPLVLALHFGFSLVALASAVLVAIHVGDIGRPAPAPVARSTRWATWGFGAFVYVLVYSGAYIRHAGAAAACTSWPLCSATTYVDRVALAVNSAHRLLAVVALLGALGLAWIYRAEPGRRDLRRGTAWLVGALLLQGAAGAFLVLSGYSLLGELAHAAVTGLVFVAAAYLCMAVTLDTRVLSGGGSAASLPPAGGSARGSAPAPSPAAPRA